jgi:putative transposase
MKPGVFRQMYVQLVFAVRYRENLLTSSVRPRVFEYVSGIVSGLKHKSIIVNGYSDHIHILLGLHPSVTISDTVHDIKRATSVLINDNRLVPGHFSWQDGYGAFTYHHNQIDAVYKYILSQEKHHGSQTFKNEYISMLETNDIEYDSEYLFEFYE